MKRAMGLRKNTKVTKTRNKSAYITLNSKIELPFQFYILRQNP